MIWRLGGYVWFSKNELASADVNVMCYAISIAHVLSAWACADIFRVYLLRTFRLTIIAVESIFTSCRRPWYFWSPVCVAVLFLRLQHCGKQLQLSSWNFRSRRATAQGDASKFARWQHPAVERGAWFEQLLWNVNVMCYAISIAHDIDICTRQLIFDNNAIAQFKLSVQTPFRASY